MTRISRSSTATLRRRARAGRTASAYASRAATPRDASNNSPHRELAAYALQKILLEESDWVVPPTVLRCLELSRHGDGLPGARPYAETRCSLGVLAHWLENVSELSAVDAVQPLAVVAELAVVDGLWVRVPETPPMNADWGVRQTEKRLQLGLTRDEIDGVRARIAALVDSGEVALR